MGFKSFPVKTKITFEKGISVIVGPNGCGKSNISEAMMWVSGESNARNLRGDVMEDIIFAGTENQKALSMAEVVLIIDNSDGVLNVPTEEVEIMRRYFRSGESEYYINKKPVRLKDINELLIDVGMGKGAYSVVKQGMIGKILSQKPEERRSVFEDAAGISKYKQREKNTISKIESTNKNLVRVNDLINEVEHEMNLKKNQAIKAKKYKVKKDELIKIETDLAVSKYFSLIEDSKKFDENISVKNNELAMLITDIAKIDTKIEKMEQEINDKKNEQIMSQQTIFKFDKDIEKHIELKKMFDEQIESAHKRKKASEETLNEAEKKLAELTENGKEIEESILKNKEHIHEARDSKIKYKKECEKLQEKITELMNYKKTLWQKIHDIQKKLVRLRSDLDKIIGKLVEEIDRKKVEIIDTDPERKKLEKTIAEKVQDLKENINSGSKKDNLTSLLTELDDLIKEYFKIKDIFRDMVYEKGGVIAEKDKINHEIISSNEEQMATSNEVTNTEKQIENAIEEKNNMDKKITEVDLNIAKLGILLNNLELQISKNNDYIQENKNRISSLKISIDNEIKNVENCSAKIKEANDEMIQIERLKKESQDKLLQTDDFLSEVEEKIKKMKEERKSLKETEEIINRELIQFSSMKDNSGKRIEETRLSLIDNYDIRTEDIREDFEIVKNPRKHRENATSLRKELESMGDVNLLAINEYDKIKERFSFLSSQRADLEKAKRDLLKIISDIKKESEILFKESFSIIQKHFHEICRKLFRGGKADIILTDKENILESGIDIIVQPPGKKLKSTSLLSGGEQALAAVALIFAIFKSKPSPFCLLDEVDAPLDDRNIGLFLTLLKDFSHYSQFLIMTHNKQTMTAADSIYGVTMEEFGISKVVSLKFDKAKEFKLTN